MTTTDIERECATHGLAPHRLRGEGIGYRCRKCAVDAVTKRRTKVRDILLAERGGKCERCGYSRCKGALEWHHRDPNAKEFGLSSMTFSLERMRAETAKCDLFCSNCHREVHEEMQRFDSH